VGGWTRRAVGILAEIDVSVSDEVLTCLVGSALVAQKAFFDGAVFHPDQVQLDDFFEFFLRRCVLPTSSDQSSATTDGMIHLE
jgi:hypothetical protein